MKNGIYKSTIEDVAKKAGVSIATVSRFLNGTANVEVNTASRINTAIKDLNYRPNKMARALKMDKTNMVMLIVPDISNPYYATLYKVVQDICSHRGYMILLQSTGETMEGELEALKTARENTCDGVIYFPLFKTNETKKAKDALSIPCVTPSNLATSEVFSKQIYNTTCYLISLGHKKIIYVGGSQLSWINTQRRNGFKMAMQEAGLPFNEEDWFEMDFSSTAGYKAGKYISGLKNRPTAICAANDQLAIGIMLAFKESGIKIPEDISITGMDDIEFARLMAPPLTTVKNDPTPMAEFLAKNVCNIIEGKKDEVVVETHNNDDVIVRGSTSKI